VPSDRVTLKIPRPIYNMIKEIIEPSGFSSVNEFVTYVLRDLVSRTDKTLDADLTVREVDMIRKRLRSLGYM